MILQDFSNQNFLNKNVEVLLEALECVILIFFLNLVVRFNAFDYIRVTACIF